MLRIFKGHDARQGDVVPHIQPGTSDFSSLGKAVKDAACLRGAISLAHSRKMASVSAELLRVWA